MQKIRIDFDNPGLPQHISAVENDSQSRFFQATLYENGKAYTAPEGATYSIMYRGFGPQNQGWYDTINDGAGKRAACAVSGNVVTCEIARQALQVPGHVSIVLCVTTGKGYMLKSWPIECDCKNDRYDSTAEIESFFYVTQISNESWTQAIQAVEELKNTIDPTLSLSGKAADAKAAGDAIHGVRDDLTAETARAQAAEKANADNIAAEAERAQAAESALSTKITEETERAKAAEQATSDALATKAVIDDTTVGTDAWSSKHIVDMLCPPLEETGNPVQCYPVVGYPLSVKANWEPTQEGSGDPSPDNVRPIKGRDSVTVERCGENLLNPKENAYVTYAPYGLTITYIGDNKVHLSGTYQKDGGSFVILNTRQKLLAGKGLKITGFTIAGTTQSYKLYGLRAKDETAIAMLARFAKGDVIDMTVAVVVSGSQVPTTYAPYTGQTATLTLPRTIYGGTVDAVTGEGQETWMNLNDFNSYNYNEGTTLSGWTQSEDAVAWYVYEPTIILNSSKVLSNIFNYTPEIVSTVKPYTIGSGNGYIAFRIPRSVVATKDDVKNWLKANDVKILVENRVQTPFTATGAQPISALAGVNTVLTDADSATVTGRADPIKRITDLETSIASMT